MIFQHRILCPGLRTPLELACAKKDYGRIPTSQEGRGGVISPLGAHNEEELRENGSKGKNLRRRVGPWGGSVASWLEWLEHLNPQEWKKPDGKFGDEQLVMIKFMQ